MYKIKRFRILDTPVDAVDMKGALAFVDQCIETASAPGVILAANPEKVYALRENSFLKEFFEKAILLIPDGIGFVLALRWLYGVKVSRVPGADLMQEICARSAQTGHKIFIYGASEEVNKGAIEELKKRHPSINIVGRANGYVHEQGMGELVDSINQSGADILFVGLGSPRQEQWIQANLPKLHVKLCQGIGGTLDTITGNVQRAPKLFQSVGLEWFYRLLKQPSRAKRQAKLFVFVCEVLLAKFGIIKWS